MKWQMCASLFFVLGSLALAGCVSPDEATDTDPGLEGTSTDCSVPAEVTAASGEADLTFWVGNEADKTVCLDIQADGKAVGGWELAPPPERLPAQYEQRAAISWQGDTVTVRATDSTRQVSAEETFTLSGSDHIVVSVFQDRIQIQHSEDEPNFA